MALNDFWKGRRVFVTGHTGFKGSWLRLWLDRLGAETSCVALAPNTDPSLYDKLQPWTGGGDKFLDIREEGALTKAMQSFEPEVVIHMAAQALVRESYDAPVETFSTNVMGTVHLLEAVRQTPSVKTVLVVTSDKVYANEGLGVPFDEASSLGGKDPYSNSKACTELVCQSYRDSFLEPLGIRVATVRAGNVIGGGDWSKDRLIPDFIRAFEAGEPVELRYPRAVRPWQHVMEPLSGYIRFAQVLTEHPDEIYPTALNFGPDARSFATVADVAEALGKAHGRNKSWQQSPGMHPPEADTLTLDSSLATKTLGWRPRLDFQQTVDWTAAWYSANRQGADMRAFTLSQIADYEEAV